MKKESKENKLTNQQYKFVCELIWGNAPVDREWAEETPIFQTNAPKILEKYPLLDTSFFKKKESEVFDNWSGKIVFSGDYQKCVKYVDGNNVYQANYSKLTIHKN